MAKANKSVDELRATLTSAKTQVESMLRNLPPKPKAKMRKQVFDVAIQLRFNVSIEALEEEAKSIKPEALRKRLNASMKEFLENSIDDDIYDTASFDVDTSSVKKTNIAVTVDKIEDSVDGTTVSVIAHE